MVSPCSPFLASWESQPTPLTQRRGSLRLLLPSSRVVPWAPDFGGRVLRAATASSRAASSGGRCARHFVMSRRGGSPSFSILSSLLAPLSPWPPPSSGRSGRTPSLPAVRYCMVQPPAPAMGGTLGRSVSAFLRSVAFTMRRSQASSLPLLAVLLVLRGVGSGRTLSPLPSVGGAARASVKSPRPCAPPHP